MPQLQHALHLRSPQIEVAVSKPQRLVGLHAVLDQERRRLRLRQDLHRGPHDLDLPRRELRVDRAIGTRLHPAFDTDHGLAPKVLGGRVRVAGANLQIDLWIIFHSLGCKRVEYNLDDSLAIAQVEKDHPAMIALVCHPTAQDDILARVMRAELSACVCAHGRRKVVAVQVCSRIQATTSVIGTVSS